MYAAPRTMPLAAMAAQIFPPPRNDWSVANTPWRIRNSPMKPFKVGRPIEDIVMTRNTAANTGITFDNPPYSEISRV